MFGEVRCSVLSVAIGPSSFFVSWSKMNSKKREERDRESESDN